jgi:hypothetical protein
MQKSRMISNLIAIVLLIALSQKTGFGFFYHNWQHSKNCNTTAPVSPTVATNCTCIDDFSMPFTETADQKIDPAPVFLQDFSDVLFVSVFTTICFYNSLRAPPFLLS